MVQPRRPHILLITSHDVGRHLGCYGIRTVHSPNLDRLASEGVRLSRCFCTAPQCSPSRSSIATGRYPHCNGVMGLTHGPFAWDLHPGERHVAQILRATGYHTVLASQQHECRRGTEGMGFVLRLGLSGDGTTIGQGVCAYLRQRPWGDQPLFMQLGFPEPHRTTSAFGHPPDAEHGVTVPPYLLDEPSAREEFADFQGAIRKLDEAIGTVLDALRQTGLVEDTLVLFCADHGIPFPRAKASLYDPGLEVATILRWPRGQLTGGAVVEDLLSNLDYLPTLLDLLDLPIPAEVQGRSFAARLQGRRGPGRSEVFAEMTYHDYCDPRRCIRTERHKLIVNFTTAPFCMDPSQSWRPKTVTRAPGNPPFAYHEPVELYDLTDDLLETRNLAQDKDSADTCAGLLRRLHQWMATTHDPLLEGIPAPPMHALAVAALRTGRVFTSPEAWRQAAANPT